VLVSPFYAEGAAIEPDVIPEKTSVNLVGSDFFSTIALPIRRGRALNDGDQSRPPHVAVVSEALAARLSPALDVIGRRIRLGSPADPPVEIVGVAANAVVDEFGERPMPTVYLPHDGSAGEFSVIAWTSLAPGGSFKAVDDAVHSLDASLAIFEPMTMEQHLADRMDGERGMSRMLGVAGALALGLAAFGLYGVTTYTVTRRTREIGVRVALGASRRAVLRLILGDAARLAVTGIVLGLVPGIALTYLLSGMIFGIGLADPIALAIATALLTSAALLASYLPARRALRVNPLSALRSE
jgi:putative ABC transport system permease protein